jgi:predicted ATPase
VELRNSQQLTEIELGPLNVDEVTTLAEQVAGQALAPAVTAQLFRETEGNPLFVVETVRAGGQERTEEAPPVMGALAQPRPPSSMPVKVHAVIQSRLAQLSSQARDLASLAATLGRSFTFAVLARASDSSEETLVRGLDELWQRGIVREQGRNAYDFSHDRIREAAYAAISPVRRRVLHRRVAEALAGVYAEELDALSAQLAVHYEQAGLGEEALLWRQRAAAAARRLHATIDAIGHLKAALALLDSMPQTDSRKGQQFVVLADLGAAQIMAYGYSSPEVEQTLMQARQLAVYRHDPHRLFQVLKELRSFHTARGNLRAGLAAINEALLLAERLGEAELRTEAHYFYASSYAQMGELEAARTQFQQAEALRTDFTDVPPPVGLALWSLGYPHQALDVSQRSLAWAEQRSEYFPMVNSMGGVAHLYVLLSKPRPLVSLAESLIVHATRFDYPQFHRLGMVLLGWALTALGNSVEGMDWMRRGIDALREMRFHTLQPFYLAMQAECYTKVGTLKAAHAPLAEALSISERFGLRFWDAELYRLQGELVLAQGGIEDEAIAYYRQAIEIARQQRAKSLELRAVLSLSHLWQSQGRQAEARRMLAAIYGWFSEGFDTPDLQAAQALLDALPEHQ